MPEFVDPLTSLECVQFGVLQFPSSPACTGAEVDYLALPAVEDPKLTRNDVLGGDFTAMGISNITGDCVPVPVSLGRVLGPMPFGGVQVGGGGTTIQFQPGRSMAGDGGRLLTRAGSITGRLPKAILKWPTPNLDDVVVADAFGTDMLAQTGPFTFLAPWGNPELGGQALLFDKNLTDFSYPSSGFARAGTMFRLVVFYSDQTLDHEPHP